VFFFIFVMLCMHACKKPDDFGLNVQPQGDLLNIEFSDTTSIVAYTVRDDSLQTNLSLLNLLGSMKDPIFGSVTAGFCTQFEPQEFNINFGSNPVVDSLVLVLAYYSYYGDTTTNQTVKVYELSASIPDDTLYSNYNPQYDITELANYTYQPRPASRLMIDTLSEFPQLRIKLSSVLADKFIKADTTPNTGVFGSIENFQNYFKGLYVTATPVSSKGAVSYFDFKKTQNSKLISKLILYYHNSSEDSLSQGFIIGKSSLKINKFDHNNYLDAAQILKDQINGNTSLGDSLLYLQAMAGVSVKLNFPYLLNWYSAGKIVINRAELIVKAEENGTFIEDFSASSKLTLAGNDSASHYYFLIDDDSYIGGTNLGGSYNTGTKEYHFNITRQIQDFLNKNNPKNGLYLTISGKTTNATRVVVKGTKRSEGRLRLKLTYTRL